MIMDTAEQIQKDIEFGRSLKRGPCNPFVGEANITDEDRYNRFRERLILAGVTRQELEIRISAGLRAKRRITAKFRGHGRGNVHRLKLVV